MAERKPLTKAQIVVLTAAFVPMLGTGVAGGAGTFSNISRTYGQGTALGAVAAGEGATAVLALVLLGLTMLGQSSPRIVRLGLWALPAAASTMAAMAGGDAGRTVIYAVTPMGMCVAAEGMAFLARRIVVHQDARDAEAEARAAGIVRSLAYHHAVASNHPDEKERGRSERKAWKLARKVGAGDQSLGLRLLDVQRQRVTAGADTALAAMFTTHPATVDVPLIGPAGADQDAPPTSLANQDEAQQGAANQSPSGLEESAPDAPAAAAEESANPVPVPVPIESARAKEPQTANRQPRRPRRRPTGRVPASARSARPTRTPDELLAEAREATAGWTEEELTAEAIRKAVRTAPVRARALRDTLRAERQQGASEVAA
ncbi:conjugal transfer protein [Streptomyces cacaoi]|uniref:conjugal transfer protein n=1 Tax=Streptomyces cacaoi TaxID=1898 RepID=UPI002618DFFF|nr:conjugal transfer protein [Streptomyces cacaoi]